MNELFKLLAENKISLTGEMRDGEIIGKFQDDSDKDPIWCTFVIKPEDLSMSVEAFILLFATPAVISIKHARQRKKIESVREQAQKILDACKSGNDLVIYGSIMSNLLRELERLCSMKKD